MESTLTLADHKTHCLTADSVGEFIALLPDTPKTVYTEDWAGATYDDAKAQAVAGDPSYVERSDALLEKIETDFAGEGFLPVTSNALTGGAVNVPAFLSGSPLAMRQRRRQVAEGGEIVLMVNCFISAIIPHETIMRRGVAQLALVRALATVRPVRLFIYGSHTGKPETFFGYFVETAPLDLARAAWSLCAPQSYRQVMLAAHYMLERKNETYAQQDLRFADAWAREVVGAEATILTPPLVSRDGTAPFETDEAAAAWVQAKVREALALDVAA